MTEENNKPTENELEYHYDADSPIDTPLEKFFYHQRRAFEETSKALDALLPPDFRKHSGEASKEFSKGFRVLVDAAIDELKKVSEKEDPNDETIDAPEAIDYVEVLVNEDDDDDEPPTTGSNKVKIKLD